MKFELKAMYSYLMSHTFPGALFGIEIIFSLKWFCNCNLFPSIQTIISNNTGGVLIFIILAYAVSTLLGIVVDAIHHFFYEDAFSELLKKLFCKGKAEDQTPGYNRFTAIKDNMSMEAYKHFIDEEYYYPYEAYANISVVMFFGIFLFAYWLLTVLRYEWNSLNFTVPFAIYFIILIIMIWEARSTSNEMDEEEEDFVKAFSNRQSENGKIKSNNDLL